MPSATLIILEFEKSLDKPREPGSNRATFDETINLIRQDANCNFLYKGYVLGNLRKVVLLVGTKHAKVVLRRVKLTFPLFAGWTTESCAPSLESLLPYLATLPSAHHLQFSMPLDSMTSSGTTVPCDIHILHLPPSSTSSSTDGLSSSFAGVSLRDRIEMLKLNPYMSGNPANPRSVVAHMPSKAGKQAFRGCYRAWSQTASLTHEQEAAAQAGKSTDKDDEGYVLIVQWYDRQSGEAFKNPTIETENLNPDIWQTHFTAEIDQLQEYGITRKQLCVELEHVPMPDRHQSAYQAPLQLSCSQSLSRSRPQSTNESGGSSRSQSLRRRTRSQSFGRESVRSVGEELSRGSFDVRERSQSLGERCNSIGEVRNQEVGRAVEQRHSLSLREISKFQFEADSDSDDDDGVGGEATGHKRKDSGTELSSTSGSGLAGIREEEEDESGELRESVANLCPEVTQSMQIESARAKLEGTPPASDSDEEGPVPMRGNLIDEARDRLNTGWRCGLEKRQRKKRYSVLLDKDDEEKQEESKGLGLGRTKTLPMQVRDSLMLELGKSRMERMGSVH